MSALRWLCGGHAVRGNARCKRLRSGRAGEKIARDFVGGFAVPARGVDFHAGDFARKERVGEVVSRPSRSAVPSQPSPVSG